MADDHMVIDLSSDEDDVPSLPNPDGEVAPADLNPIKLESGVNEPVQAVDPQLSVNHGVEDGSVTQKTEAGVIGSHNLESKSLPSTTNQPSSSREAQLQINKIDSSINPSQQSILSKSSDPTNQSNDQDGSDDDIEIVEEVKGPPQKLLINTKLLNLGNTKYYQQAALLFSNDTTGMAKKMVIDMIKKTDGHYNEVMNQIAELKARQGYREKVLEDLNMKYKSLQNDIFRLGNPLDV